MRRARPLDPPMKYTVYAFETVELTVVAIFKCFYCTHVHVINVLRVITGGTVHMVCRNKQRGEEALDEIKKESGNMVSAIGP